jgi:hypothetical protein
MQKQTVTATLFVPPRGERREIEVSKVLPDDADYINRKGIKVSLEELMTGDTVVYFDDGKRVNDDPDEDPDEIIIISRGGKTTCEECFREGVELLKKREAA